MATKPAMTEVVPSQCARRKAQDIAMARLVSTSALRSWVA
jgi:hypothetical protein